MSADELYENGDWNMNIRTGSALISKYDTLAITIVLRPTQAVFAIQHRPS